MSILTLISQSKIHILCLVIPKEMWTPHNLVKNYAPTLDRPVQHKLLKLLPYTDIDLVFFTSNHLFLGRQDNYFQNIKHKQDLPYKTYFVISTDWAEV